MYGESIYYSSSTLELIRSGTYRTYVHKYYPYCDLSAIWPIVLTVLQINVFFLGTNELELELSNFTPPKTRLEVRILSWLNTD